jgi:hypothetical protein
MPTFVLTCVAILFGLTGVASAQQRLASPPLPKSQGNSLACYVRNIGTSPMVVNVVMLQNVFSPPIAPDFDNCNTGPLGAGRTCVLLSRDPDSTFVTCTATADRVSNLRGTLEIRETTPILRVLVSEELK